MTSPDVLAALRGRSADEDGDYDINVVVTMLMSGQLQEALQPTGILDHRGNLDIKAAMKLLGKLDEVGLLKPEVIKGIVDNLYEPHAEKIRPLLTLLPVVTGKVGQDGLATILTSALGLVLGVAENETIREQSQALRVMKAKARRALYDAYLEAFEGVPGNTDIARELMTIDAMNAKVAQSQAMEVMRNPPRIGRGKGQES